MTIVAIPTRTDTPHWDQVTTLDGVDYTLGFRYNQRENVYYLIVADALGTVLNGGIKLVSNLLLLQNVIDTRMPPGELIAQTYGANDASPGLGELGIGQRATLWYIPQVDMQAANLDANRDPLALLP